MQDTIKDQARDTIAGASEVLSRLRGAFALSSLDDSDTVFYTRSRVKNPDSLVAKVFDRQIRYSKPYTVSDVTDIVGFRLVVLYDDQLIDAVKLVLKAIDNCASTDDDLVDGNDIWKNIHEIKVFPRRNRISDPYVNIHDKLAELYPEQISKIKKDDASLKDYSSMHLIIYMNSYSMGHKKRIPVEFQIRTAIEDVWSEISHKNKYKIRRPYIWSPHLSNLYTNNEDAVNIIKVNWMPVFLRKSQMSEKLRKVLSRKFEILDHQNGVNANLL